jgi:hypothetical protein
MKRFQTGDDQTELQTWAVLQCSSSYQIPKKAESFLFILKNKCIYKKGLGNAHPPFKNYTSAAICRLKHQFNSAWKQYTRRYALIVPVSGVMTFVLKQTLSHLCQTKCYLFLQIHSILSKKTENCGYSIEHKILISSFLWPVYNDYFKCFQQWSIHYINIMLGIV